MGEFVNTVLGPVSADALGATYIHEHLYVKPCELPEFYPYTLDNVEKSVEEAKAFKAAGGVTMVEMSPLNFGRNTEALRTISEQSGVNIVCITGFHKQAHIPQWFYELDDAEVSHVVIDEIEDGIGWSHVLPGAIKVGSSFNDITEAERRAIALCGVIAADFDLPVITHCDKGTMALEQIELLGAAGVSSQRICLSHVDLTLDVEYLKRICDTGAFISFDHVGRDLEGHDHDRVEMLAELVRCGFGDKVCLAGDMGKKDYFASYGGNPGLDYILTMFKEWACERISEDDFMRMVVDNPRHVLVG